jgi:hypothetical protein
MGKDKKGSGWEEGSVRLLLVEPARHYENRTDPCPEFAVPRMSKVPGTVLCAGLEECSMIRHDALPFCFELQRLT